MEREIKKKKKECQICGKVVVDLPQHMTVHSELRLYKCAYCEKGFKAKGNLTKHHKIHTREKREKPFKCELCGKTFNQSSNLSIHMKIHNETKKEECQICGQVVVKLSQHMIVHSELRPFKCEFCERDFKTKGELTAHKKIHAGQTKINECQICGKVVSNLTEHMTIHSELKPYKC